MQARIKNCERNPSKNTLVEYILELAAVLDVQLSVQPPFVSEELSVVNETVVKAVQLTMVVEKVPRKARRKSAPVCLQTKRRRVSRDPSPLPEASTHEPLPQAETDSDNVKSRRVTFCLGQDQTDDSEVGELWACNRCTFINKSMAKKCKVCSAKKRR